MYYYDFLVILMMIDFSLAFLKNNPSDVESKQSIPLSHLIPQNASALIYSSGSQAPYDSGLACYSCIKNDYIYCIYGQ